MGSRRLNTLHLFMSLKLKIGLCSNGENSVITKQILTKLICFVKKGLLHNSTKWIVNQSMRAEEYSEYFGTFLTLKFQKTHHT